MCQAERAFRAAGGGFHAGPPRVAWLIATNRERWMKTGTKLAFLAFGLALACTALWMYQVRQVDIPEDRTAFVLMFLVAAGLGVAALVKGAGWIGGLPAGLAIFLGLFLPFTIAVSPQEAAARAIQVGDTMPHFTATEASGEAFDSESLNGHLLLIKFFRAHW
jgi:uncharacterized oligopeptide transporter (OPT) family protein